MIRLLTIIIILNVAHIIFDILMFGMFAGEVKAEFNYLKDTIIRMWVSNRKENENKKKQSN
ncbi:MAG: hypothetical protein IJ272_01825 [Clostridia bacterium]|nr:hypothetical protein [Clostridia bacterium]